MWFAQICSLIMQLNTVTVHTDILKISSLDWTQIVLIEFTAWTWTYWP